MPTLRAFPIQPNELTQKERGKTAEWRIVASNQYNVQIELHPVSDAGPARKFKRICKGRPDLSNELLMYGSIAGTPKREKNINGMVYDFSGLIFTVKPEIFKYKLACNQKMPSRVVIEPL